MRRTRLDQLLVQRGFAPSREKAQALILSGLVLVNDAPATKAGQQIPDEAAIRLRGEISRFVGRGGEKLEPALKHFNLDLGDRVVIDVGSSTGGFTDCVLQRGARRVYAVDVGTNQLDYKLRVDDRVVVMEQTHVKDLATKQFDPLPSLALVDLSFISVAKVLSHIIAVLAPVSDLLILVKPQFELEPEYVEKGGVVRNLEHQLLAIERVVATGQALGLEDRGVVPCELKGAKSGNQEHFLLLHKPVAF